MRDAKHYLGMEVLCDRKRLMLKLSERQAIVELLKRWQMTYCAPKATALGVGFQATKASKALRAVELKHNQELVGSLNYLANCTRPDIAQAVGLLSRFLNAPSTEHSTASKSVLRYLAGTKDLGILYSGSDTTMKGFCDADFDGDLDSKRSTTSYMLLVNGGAMSWSSRLQKTVALSAMDAEIMTFTSGASEGLWLE
ncbi:hypothetical protein MPTK1_8g00200 [Marchantia polymorpha subsp. ruderalis]|nr:hypothetical protein Mp_8g00200 [Marchantia polymorpha subsp. ruderalis]